MHKAITFTFTFTFTLTLTVAVAAVAGCSLVRGKLPGPAGARSDQDPITTRLPDAKTEVSTADGFWPRRQTMMSALARGEHGAFVIPGPGAYDFWARSYCLHAGTHAPTAGDGYLLAPLQGQRRDLIQHILQRTVDHLDVDQHKVQELIWAILARAKFSTMSDEMRATAATLLTPEEIAQLDDTAITEASEGVEARLEEGLPDIVKQSMKAESDMRAEFASGKESYDDLERMAVLPAGVGPKGPGSRDVPPGRWSYDATHGWFVRYLPEGYPLTYEQLFVPDAAQVTRDGKGRITKIVDARRSRIEVSYDDAAQPVPGDDGVVGYTFKSVRVVTHDRALPEIGYDVTRTAEGMGYALVGVPTKKHVKAPGPGRFSDLDRRYDAAVAARDDLARVAKTAGRTVSDGAAANVVGLAEFVAGVKGALGDDAAQAVSTRDGAGDDGFVAEEAWMNALCSALGDCSAELGWQGGKGATIVADVSPTSPVGPGSGGSHDSSGDVATPADTSRQRLAQSDAENHERANQKQCDQAAHDRDEANAFKQAFSDKGLQDKHRYDSDTKGYSQDVASQALGKHVDMGESGKGSESGGAQEGMGTDPGTCTVNAPSREQYAKNGWDPGIGYDADYAHEQAHVAHCKANQSGFMAATSTTSGLGAEEANAYGVKANYLSNWMAQHCQ